MLVVYMLSFLLLLWGVLYMIRIALSPFPVGQTWVSVVIGCAATAAGMSGLIAYCGYFYGLSPDQVLVLAAIPWWCLALTGLPQAGGQYTKHELRAHDAHTLEAEGDNGHAA